MRFQYSLSPQNNIYAGGNSVNISCAVEPTGDDEYVAFSSIIGYSIDNSTIVWNNRKTNSGKIKSSSVGTIDTITIPVNSSTSNKTIKFYGACEDRYSTDNDITASDYKDPDKSKATLIHTATIQGKANSSPVISGKDSNLGNKSISFIQSFYVNDNDVGDTLTVTVKLDTTQLSSFTATRNTNYTIDLATKWNTLSNAQHTITITCTDGKATATRVYTFTKIASSSGGGSSGGNTGVTTSTDIFEFPFKKLDLKRDKEIQINCKQLDDIILNFEIYNNGAKADITGFDVELNGGIGNNIVITSKGITKNGNTVTIECPRQLTAIAGDVIVELKFSSNGKQKRSFNVILNVQKCVAANVTPTILITALQELEENINSAKELNNSLSYLNKKADELHNKLVSDISIANPVAIKLEENISVGKELAERIEDKNSEINKHIRNMDIHVTKEQKDRWEGYNAVIQDIVNIIDEYLFKDSFVVDDDNNNIVDDEGNTIIV